MKQQEKLLMLSAMYENGGNMTHRFLDGHPELYVYPFESQLGTKYVNDHLSSLYPVKYRWPAFLLDATPYQDYKAIIDEEAKIRAITPKVSKFRHMPMDFSDEERCQRYIEIISKTGKSRGANVMAFFKATFDTWKDYKRTGEEKFFVGYSPIIIIDAEKILQDLPEASLLHIVRNPWSAYGETKKRPVPLSLDHYMNGWVQNQYYATLFQKKYPGRVTILRTEDIMAEPKKVLGAFCEKLGLQASNTLSTPSWNGMELQEIYPFGTIRQATLASSRRTAEELSQQEKEEIRLRASHYLDVFGYQDFI